MASIPLTLAALATSAVPGLVVLGVRPHDCGDDYLAAVVSGEERELLVRVPRTQSAEVRQSAELLGISALTEGSRSQLPFEVPEALGVTRAGETRAVVTTYLDGAVFEAADLHEDTLLLQPIAEVLAAIHGLPRTVAQHGGLPERAARDLRVLTRRLVDRADATRMVPETVVRRWNRVLDAPEVWDFAPTIVHGSLDAEHLRVDGERITGVLGWGELSVGDPASDMSWLLEGGSETLGAVLGRYTRLRGSGSPTHTRTRAALYYELRVARWLLHGVEAHDSAVIDDAVAMLDRMVTTGGMLGASSASDVAREPLGESEVSEMLSETPEVVDHLSDSAVYEALDEDRMFGVDTDFVEPLNAGTENSGSEAETDTAEAVEDQNDTGAYDADGSDAGQEPEPGSSARTGDRES
ncbi:MAG: phosphotransferase [Leucobacter sp.]